MNKHKPVQRLMAIALTVVMLLGMLPISAVAEGTSLGTSGEIIAFEALDEEMINQEVALGTSLEDLSLPETIMATVRIATATDLEEPEEPVQDSGKPAGTATPSEGTVSGDEQESEESGGESHVPPVQTAIGSAISLGESKNSEFKDEEEPTDTGKLGFMEITIPVPVEWVAHPAYDGETAGVYTFTAEVEGYVVSAPLPAITITVGEGLEGFITAFAELPEDIRWQRSMSPILPETVEGTVNGESKDIPVTWECETDSTQTGLHVFTAKPGEDLQLAAGVNPPTIAFMRTSLGRMAGAGTETNPLQITNANQLAEIAAAVNAGKLEEIVTGSASSKVYLKLMNDINLSAYGAGWNGGKGWEPIGHSISTGFKGSFDGGDNKIAGLYIDHTGYESTGLFGWVDSGAEVKNLGVSGVNITGGDHTGGVAGAAVGRVENCYSTGSVSGNNRVGGVAGMVGGTVESCYSIGSVSGNDLVGGVAGAAVGTVENCYSTGSVSGTGDFVGGVAGWVTDGGRVENCDSAGSVSGNNNVGGVAGVVANSGTVENCYSTGSVSGNDLVGGVAGWVFNTGTVESCYSTGSVSGNNKVGGVAGVVANHGTVQNCMALNPSVSANGSDVGRVAGYNNGGILTNNYAFSGMDCTSSGTDYNDGAGKTAAEIQSSGTLFGLFSGGSWTTANGSLPGLFGQTLPMPGHINDSGLHFAGDGSVGDPFKITTAAELARLADIVNNDNSNAAYNASTVYYKLTADLDLSAYSKTYNGGKGWAPIGHDDSARFKGSFDGGGHKITGLYIDHTSYDYTGLFGDVAGGAEVKNLGVAGVSITGGDCTGGVAGAVDGRVENCYSTGSVSGNDNVGGVAGGVSGTGRVENCYSTGSVSGNSAVGGVAGSVASNGKVQNCYSIGSVSGNNCVGGVAGIVQGRVENCVALNPAVSGSTVGRVAGFNMGGTLAGNYAFSGMTGAWSNIGHDQLDGADKSATEIQGSGTLFGLFSGGGWTTADGALPGLFGQTVPMPGYINDSGYAFAGDGSVGDPFKITTAAELAKLAELVNASTAPYANAGVHYKLTNDINLSDYGKGWNDSKGWAPIGHDTYARFKGSFDGGGHEITGLYIDHSGYNSTGLFGLVASGAEVKNLGVADVNITGGDYSGGVAGYVIGRVENCYSTGSASGTSDFVGGVAGAVGSDGRVQNCYSTGSVSGNGGVGGVAGYVYGSGRVENCYSTGSVSGNGVVGGVAGWVIGRVENCYSTGSISGNGGVGAVGGVVGIVQGRVENCYSTGNVSGNSSVGGVAGYVEGTVKNCAALNPSVRGGVSDVGRVTGYKESSATLANNYAFSGMDCASNGEYDNGTPMSAAQAVQSAFWNTAANWSASAWLIQNGKLPTLKNVGGSQDGDTGLYLNGKSLEHATVTVNGTYTYNGTAHTPTDLTVKFGDTTLTKDVDYTITGYSNNTNAGSSAKIEVTGNGAYTGVAVGTFTIKGIGGSGGSSSSNNSTITTWTVTPGKTTDMPTTAVQSDTNQPDSSGQLTMNVTKKMIEDGITEAKKKWSGREAYGIALSFENNAENVKSLTATIDADALDYLVAQGVKSLTIQCGIIRITVDEKAIKELDTQSSGNITVTVSPYKVSGAAQAAIGIRPVYDITFTDSQNKAISSFGKGSVAIGIAYQTSNAGTGRLSAVYVKSNNEVEWLQNSSYDNGWLMFSRSSLSVYGVGYKPSAAFTDTATHWAKDNIDFVVSRGLFSGTSDTTFSPNTAITRGMFVTALGRLSNADMSGYTTSSFSDVKAGSYYLSYIEWAVKNGIVKGVGDNQFAPDRAITREEMAVIMENYAKVAGYTLPVARQYTAFTDDSSISSWAKSAVIATQQAGIINGKDGGKYDPQGSATRAEAATILRRFVELVVDESTALGWVKNDVGQWQHYDWQGKRTTGWLTITGTDIKYYFDKNGIIVTGKWVEIGGKWYYFYVDGKLARNTTVEGYKVDGNGVRQG